VTTLYDFTATTIDGQERQLSDYEGKAVLVVNTASKCGFTPHYGVSFPMFAKVDVNGDDAHPLFKWLRSEKGGMLGAKIKWNFTKFLVNRRGEAVKRYASTTKPDNLTGDIDDVLRS